MGSVLWHAARAGKMGAHITPQDLCPAQQSLPCAWTPQQLVAPPYASVSVNVGNGRSIDLLKVIAKPHRPVSRRSGMSSMPCSGIGFYGNPSPFLSPP